MNRWRRLWVRLLRSAQALRGRPSEGAYGVPLALAVLVHVAAALALVEGWSGGADREPLRIREPVQARLVAVEAQAPETEQQPEPAPPAAPEREQPASETKPLPTEPAPARPEPEQETRRSSEGEVDAEASEPDPEDDARTAAPEVEREDSAWRDQMDQSFERALAEETEQRAAEQAEAAARSHLGSLVAAIEEHWSRPPSARDGMQVELQISLVPSGELVAINVVRSSGNAAFDRSAELAVRQAAPFSVPQDPKLFEQQFRQLRLLFTPEDLRNR